MAGTPHERSLRAVGPADALHHAEEHDPLTGLLNAVGIERRVATATPGSMLLVGVDPGHGDAVVAIAGRRFAGEVRPTDVIGRIGDDEFVVFLPGADVYAATIVGGRMLDVLDELIDVAGTQLRLGVSVGIDPVAEHDLDQHLTAATAALARAVAAGGGRIEVAKA
jgi:GGDEF domain-containing protein